MGSRHQLICPHYSWFPGFGRWRLWHTLRKIMGYGKIKIHQQFPTDLEGFRDSADANTLHQISPHHQQEALAIERTNQWHRQVIMKHILIWNINLISHHLIIFPTAFCTPSSGHWSRTLLVRGTPLFHQDSLMWVLRWFWRLITLWLVTSPQLNCFSTLTQWVAYRIWFAS